MSFKNTKEIYQALIDGKKLHNVEWSEKCYVYLNKDGFLIDNYGLIMSPDFSKFKDWEIYQEPKKKVKFYAYMNQVGTKISFWVLSGYFRNDEEYKSHYPTQNIWTKKEDNFIEVEE